jgi:hypothetical protein
MILHLNYVAQNILTTPSYFHDAVLHFSKFLPKILSIAITFSDQRSFNYDQHRINCVLLGKIVQFRQI